MAVGVEMGRAVRVGIGLHAEGMGHEMVHAPDQEVIGQVLLQPDALLPAVVSEYLAHAVAALRRVDGRQRSAQPAQHEVIEPPVPRLSPHAEGAVPLALGQHLATDIVDARHVLPGEAPEVVAEAAAGAGVLVVVLDQMADVPDPMRTTPGADLLRKVFLHQPGHGVHIGKPRLGAGGGIKVLLP